MKRYARGQLSNEALHHGAISHATGAREQTAELLADLGEIKERRFFLAMAYPSLFVYCVAELRLSEDASWTRVYVASVARAYPIVLEAIADGRLCLTTVLKLKPYLDGPAAAELLEAAMGKTKSQVESLIAERFPRPDMPARVVPIMPVEVQLSARQSAEPNASPDPANLFATVATSASTSVAVDLPVPEQVISDVRSKVKPLAPRRYEVHFSMSEAGYEKLRDVQDLLGFDRSAGDLGTLFEDALDARRRELMKRKFAATDRPRGQRKASKNPRRIPAHVKSAVWKRDCGRCTYTSEDGRRCEERKGLEFDHVLAVARGGEASVDNARLRCRWHNQLEAERTFGVEFMRHKRIAAAEARGGAS